MADPHRDFYEVQHRHTRQCRHEALWVAFVWLGTLLTCGSIFAWLGYRPVAERVGEPALFFGVPSWVVFGLFVPWLAVILVTWLFARLVLRDDEDYLPFPDVSGPDDPRPRDLGARDLGARDLGPRDLGPRDLGPRDLGPRDLGGVDDARRNEAP